MPQVYLLHGQNAVDLDERVAALRMQLDPTGVGSTVLDLANAHIDEIAKACHSAPFFGAGRTIVLRNTSQTTGKSTRRAASGPEWIEVQQVVESSPASSTIIMRADENLPSSSVIVKAARKLDWIIESFPLARGEDLARWVAERGQAAGVSISRSAAILLLSRLYPTSWRQETRFDNTVLDARLIATEIEKLACGTQDGTVNDDLVIELVADRSGYTAFKLNDLVYSGQSDLAMNELEQVLSSGDEPERILAQFASEAAGLSAARLVPDFDPPSVSRVSGISEGRLRMLRQKQASRDEQALATAIERLRRAEWLVKTGRSSRSESVIVATAAEVSEAFRKARS